MSPRSLLVSLGLTVSAASIAVDSPPHDVGSRLVIQACRAGIDNANGKPNWPRDVVGEEFAPLELRDRMIGQRWRLQLADGRRMTVERIAPQNSLRGVQGELTDTLGRPEYYFAVDRRCALQRARTLVYDEHGHAVELLHLNPARGSVQLREPLNPPLPAGDHRTGVRVALVDSGVNYLLSEIRSGLARDKQGGLIGYDYWDLDDRPFDVHTPRSDFLVQRHGTRTASLLLKEAPQAQLAPYRYPRPAMERMADLIEHAARHEVRIVAIPMGSNHADEWRGFQRAAAARPEILFITSAGNNGRDIDRYPVFPAALKLDNQITVTSSDDYGHPANGVNWGAETVDLLIPAERQRVIDFNGEPTKASGSSYAVARVAALAARLLSRTPASTAAELKTAILGLATDTGRGDFVKTGLIPDPLADTANIVRGDSVTLTERVPAADEITMELSLAALRGSGWDADVIASMVRFTAATLGQCGIVLTRARLQTLEASPYLLDFQIGTAKTLMAQIDLPSPIVVLVRDTNREIGFEGEAFGRTNSRTRPWLRDTIWLIADTRSPGAALAHELFHVLTDSGEHHPDADNLMYESTEAKQPVLSAQQCRRAIEIGVRNGLLRSGA